MKKITITEGQRKRIFEAISDSFSFEYLSSLDNEEDIIEYCTETLGNPFAEGSSRAIYMIDDNIVLKVASGMYEAGIEQNKVEYEMCKKYNTNLLARVFSADPEFKWIVSEHVVPAEPVDIEMIFGIPYKNRYIQRSTKEPGEENGDKTVGYDKYFTNLRDKDEESELSFYEILEYINSEVLEDGEWFDMNIENFISSNEWLRELRGFALRAEMLDFCDIDNFGIVNRDGNYTLVILDSGMNDELWMEEYAKKL